MAPSRRPTDNTSSPHRAPKPLERLERVQPVYFFTPDLEREIGQLDGVTSCRVLVAGEEIEEIHVIALPEIAPKKLVRNIESLLLVRFGIRIDHRKISIVQMGQAAAPSDVSSPERPQIVKCEKRMGTKGVEVLVQVHAGKRIIQGVGRAQDGESDLYASSRALIHALEQLLNTQGALTLQGLSTVRVRDQEVVLVMLAWTLDGQEEILVGASVTRNNSLEGVSRATLDAMNRKLVRVSGPHTRR